LDSARFGSGTIHGELTMKSNLAATGLSSASGIAMSLFGLAVWVALAGSCLKYMQHVLGLGTFQPDWINYLVGTFFPPVVPIGIIAFVFNGIGHVLFGTSM